MTDAFDDHSRRTTILATLGVAAGACIMAAGLSLDISSLGGLWPFRSADGAAPPLFLPPTEAEDDGAENDDVALAPVAAVAIRSVEGSARPVAAGVPGVDVPPAAPPTPTTDAVETILSDAEGAAKDLLDPVLDVSGLSGGLVPPALVIV